MFLATWHWFFALIARLFKISKSSPPHLSIFLENNGTPTQHDLLQLVTMKGDKRSSLWGPNEFQGNFIFNVQQELYSRMAAWTGQKGLGDGRLYGITMQMFRRWLAYPRGEDAFGWFSASMLVEYSWDQMSFNHTQPTILQEPWASLLNGRDLQVQDGLWKLFWDLPVHGLVEIYG